MKKEKNIQKQKLFKQSKKLFNATMKNYIKFWSVLFTFGIGLILLFFFSEKNAFTYVSWSVVIINGFVTTLFLVIFDGIPARKIRKGGFSIYGMNKEKGIVFYNALKLRTIFRGLLNIFGTFISIIMVVILMYL